MLTDSVRIFKELYCVLLSLHTSSESLKLLSSKHPFPGHSTSMLTKLRLQARSCMRPLTICNTLSASQVWFAERGGNIWKKQVGLEHSIHIYRVSHPFVDNFGLNFLFFKTRYYVKKYDLFWNSCGKSFQMAPWNLGKSNWKYF